MHITIKIPDIKKNDVDVAVLWLKVKPLSITETGTLFNNQPCINTGKAGLSVIQLREDIHICTVALSVNFVLEVEKRQ